VCHQEATNGIIPVIIIIIITITIIIIIIIIIIVNSQLITHREQTKTNNNPLTTKIHEKL